MSALKKKIIYHNISNFLEKNLLVFFFNYNHINTEEWGVIKNQLSKRTPVDTLVVKNRIGKKVIRKKNTFKKCEREIDKIEKLSTLFQGPTFLIGIASSQGCEAVFSVLNKQKKCIFVGGLYMGQLINHLDIKYLLKVEKVAYTDLISTLQYPLYLTPITTNRVQLYYLLKSYQDSKERVSK